MQVDEKYNYRPLNHLPIGKQAYLQAAARIPGQAHILFSILLLECGNDWTIELNCRHTIDVAYIDFQKVFDSVVHSNVCHKLKCYGVW